MVGWVKRHTFKYGGGSATSFRRGHSRSAAVARARARTNVRMPHLSKFNSGVYKKLKKPLRTTKTGRNRSAITTLARQVKVLQNQQYGDLQQNSQFLRLTGAALPSSAGPVAFLLNSFYDQTTYKGTIVGTLAGFTNGPAFARQTYAADLDDQYEWLARQNTEIVSPVRYKPVYCRLNIKIYTSDAGPNFGGNIRVTVLKIKDYNTTNKINCVLPGALGAYRNLAVSPALATRNYFSPTFHKVLLDKWVNLRSTAKQATDDQEGYRIVSIPWKFREAGDYEPNFNLHPPNQEFWTNVPRHKQLWVLISVDDGAASWIQSIQIGKVNMWRDHHSQA